MTQPAEPHPSAPSQTVERGWRAIIGPRSRDVDHGTAIQRRPPDKEGLQIHSEGGDTWQHILAYDLGVVIVLGFDWLTLNRVQFASKHIRVVHFPGWIFGLPTSENFVTTNWKITPGAIWPGVQGLSTTLNRDRT